jgi:hypothetical protein
VSATHGKKVFMSNAHIVRVHAYAVHRWGCAPRQDPSLWTWTPDKSHRLARLSWSYILFQVAQGSRLGMIEN